MLFFKKKNENITKEKLLDIKVLGLGCKACHQQFENAKEAVKNLGLSVEVEYISELEQIMQYGTMSMPAVVINQKVAFCGKTLRASEFEKYLTRYYF